MTAKDVDDTSFRDHVVASCQPSNFDDHLSSCPRAFVPCCREWTRGKTKVESENCEKGGEREREGCEQAKKNRPLRGSKREGMRERWKSEEGSLEVTFRRGELRASRQSTRSLSGDTEKPWFSPHTHTHVRERVACPRTSDPME